MQWSFSLSAIWTSAVQKCHGLIPGFLKHKWSPYNQSTHQALLGTQDLLTIHAAANTSSTLSSKHEVATLLVGERSSSYAGSGYEFAENQLFVAGDDSRFINWRMLAKTGKIYRKKFIEERKPEIWIVMDKRASMRFGTQQRLKVTKAAIEAVYHIYQGQQQQLACGGVILDKTVQWYSPSRDTKSLQPLIEGIIAPTPPLHEQSENDVFNQVVRQLVNRATAGSIIILISDFHDLSPEVSASLYLLTKKHRVNARHIIDPVEQELPDKGKYQVSSGLNHELYLLDCDNPSFREQYQRRARQFQKNIENQLTQAGVNYRSSMTNENFFAGAPDE